MGARRPQPVSGALRKLELVRGPHARGSGQLISERSRRPCSKRRLKDKGWPGGGALERLRNPPEDSRRGQPRRCAASQPARNPSQNGGHNRSSGFFLIASLGPQRKTAGPGRLKSAHCSLRGQQHHRSGQEAHSNPRRPRRRKSWLGSGPGAASGLRRRRPSLPGWGGGGDGRGRRFCGPLMPSCGS